MIKAGMSGARINTAYCSFEDYDKRIEEVRNEENKLDVKIPIMMDIKGPQLRILTADPSVNYSIKQGIVFPLGFYEDSKELKSSSDIDIFLNYNIKDEIKEGDTILIENGTIATRVLENNGNLYVQVLNQGDGIIKNNMGVNVPGRYLDLPHLSMKDEQVIDYALKNNLDYIALSFVRDGKDLTYLQDYIINKKVELGLDNKVGLIAKIEDKFGCLNFNDIIKKADKDNFDFEIMIARGDLFNEVNYSKLAHIQQYIGEICHKENVPFMIGTGLLESMKYNSRPSRAEIGDVWNALRDKPNSFLLSAETSNGKNPILAVNTLKRIIDDYST